MSEMPTVQEMPVLLRVAEKTVCTMAQRRAIPAFKIHAQWRFKWNDIDAWLATVQQGPISAFIVRRKRGAD